MAVVMPERRMRGEPFRREHEASVSSRMERGVMPRDLAGLVRWFIDGLSLELPDRLHRAELWSDSLTQEEAKEGQRPVGGSLIGSLAWSSGMKAILEGSPSRIDQDGYYVFPMRAALSRLGRRKPFVATDLAALGFCEGDWKRLAAAKRWPEERMETYLRGALPLLFNEFHAATVRRVA